MKKYYANNVGLENPEKTNHRNSFIFKNDYCGLISQYSLDTNLDFYEIFHICPGFSLFTAKCYTEKKLSIAFENKNLHGIYISFCLSGDKKTRSNEKWGNTYEKSISAGDRVICFYPKLEGVKNWMPKQYHAMVSIMVCPQFLHRNIENKLDFMPSGLRKILEGSDSDFFYKQDKIPISIQTIAHQILNCPSKERSRQLFMSGKAIELLSLQIDDMVENTNHLYENTVLNKKDIDLIYSAREVLMANVYDAPTIPELANLLGTNSKKLKAGFQRIFGTTVFGHLQQLRMEKAKLMIEDGKSDVSEIAGEIGYGNVSHFITAYQKKYGITPGRHLKKSRKNHCFSLQKTAFFS